MRLELKGHCSANGDGCYTPTKTLPTLPTHWPRHLSSLLPWVDDERGLGRGADSEGTIKWTGTSLEGGACGFTYIDKAAVSVCWAVSHATVIAGASYASLSVLSSSSGLLGRIQLTWFCWSQMIDIVRVSSRITEEGVENDNNNELGQGVEVNHSSCTMYVSGVID